MDNDGFMIFWRTTHCFEGLDVVIRSASQQKYTTAGTGKEQGIQLLMQNNAVYTLFTLLWLALAHIKSLSSSRSCLLYEVKINFPPKELLLFPADVPRFWGAYPKQAGKEGAWPGSWGAGVGAEQWDRGTLGWLSLLPLRSTLQPPASPWVGQGGPCPATAWLCPRDRGVGWVINH